MNKIIILLSLLSFGCNNQNKNTYNLINEDSAHKARDTFQRKGDARFYTTKDTLLIATETGDTLNFPKEKFNQIVDKHPELYDDFAYDPDYVYHCNGKSKDFSSEVDQDMYYVLYAYFLKQRNGIEKFAKQRRKLIDIYSNINSLFGHFQYGGTYFVHQRMRILGYAEYSVYLYPRERFEKSYNITKQKELYIKSLRQLIVDESSIDLETRGKDKEDRTKTLHEIVDKLELLITDIFYLQRAQAFQYSNYIYF